MSQDASLGKITTNPISPCLDNDIKTLQNQND
jgi:hypothetical protein